MSDFRFELTDEEKSYLKKLVVQSISFGLNPSDGPFGPPEPPTDLRWSRCERLSLNTGPFRPAPI